MHVQEKQREQRTRHHCTYINKEYKDKQVNK